MLRRAALAALALIGCTSDYDPLSGLAGVGGASADQGAGGATASAGPGSGGSAGATSSVSSGGSTSTTGAAQGGSGGGQGGQGGTPIPGFCGDGKIDPGEECDDAGQLPAQCNGCFVKCDGMYEVKHPTTHHCYYMTLHDGLHTSWEAGRTFCQAWGGDLAVLSTSAELGWATPLLPQLDVYAEDEWIGGFLGAGNFEWIDGQPWTFVAYQPPWASGEPSNGDCVGIDEQGGLRAKPCDDFGTHHMCERAPPGGT